MNLAGTGRWALPLAALLGLAAGAGCRRTPPAIAASATGPRVVSLHDITTEVVVALGVQGRLVGVAAPVQLPAEVTSALAGVPRVEGLESILSVRPDVVLGAAVVRQRSPELVRFLVQRGIPVWLAHPTTLDGVLEVVTEVADRVDAQTAGRALVARLRTRLAGGDLASVGAAESRELGRGFVRVFVYDCCDPAFTAGGSAVLTDVIARAGGHNIFADVGADWTKVSWEEVIGRRPELIVIHDYQYERQPGVAEKRRRLASFPSLAAVPVLVLPLGLSLGGLRSFEGLARLRPALAAVARRG